MARMKRLDLLDDSQLVSPPISSTIEVPYYARPLAVLMGVTILPVIPFLIGFLIGMSFTGIAIASVLWLVGNFIAGFGFSVKWPALGWKWSLWLTLPLELITFWSTGLRGVVGW